MNNIVKLRKISCITHFIVFILSVIVLIFAPFENFSFFKPDFSIAKPNLSILCLTNFCVFLFVLNSKNSLKEAKKFFYPLSVILLLIVNALILTDNIIALLVLLFLLFLIHHFLDKSNTTLFSDCIVLFISVLLLSYGSLRYLALNEMAVTFENLLKFQSRSDNFALLLSICAIMILLFRLFNFIPFRIKSTNTLISGIYSIIYLSIGSSILIKIYNLYAYQIHKIHYIIALYLILNALYYAFIQFNSKNLSEYLKTSLCANIAIGGFSLFLYDKTGIVSYIYYTIVIIISYTAGFLIANSINKRMKNCNYLSLKKINNNSKTIKFFILFVFLNIAKVPPLSGFFSMIYSFLNIFLIDFTNPILIFSPYILLFCVFLLSLNAFRNIAKILVDPIKPIKSFILTNKEIYSMLSICIIIFICTIFVQYIISYFYNTVSIGII